MASAGIPADAVAVQVLGLPAQPRGTQCAQAWVVEIVGDGDRDEVGGGGAVDQIGTQGQHHRGLDRAAVDAVAQLGGVEQAVRHAPREPVGGDHQHLVVDAQLARHDLHHLRLTAMAVQQQQLAHPGAADTGADFVPDAGQGLGGEGERAGEIDVLVALADRGGRQDEHRCAGGQQRQDGTHDAIDDAGVDSHRQMRPMLLDGAHRQHGHGCLRIEPRELGAGQILPPAGQSQRHAHLPAGVPTHGRTWHDGWVRARQPRATA